MKEKVSNDNSIYVIFSKTNTKIGWIVRKILKMDYNHVSLCPNPEGGALYSFGRKTYSVPFVGGFIKENFFRLAYPQNSVALHICEIPLCKEQQQRLNRQIHDFCFNTDDYYYNLFSFVKLWRGKTYRCYRNTYDCVEFVAELLRGAEIITERKYAGIVGLADLYDILETKCVRNYDVMQAVATCEVDKQYMEKPFLPIQIVETLYYVWHLWTRAGGQHKGKF